MPSPKDLGSATGRKDACLISLLGGPKSPQAEMLIERVLDEVVMPYRDGQGYAKKAGAKTKEKLETVIGAIFADLLNLQRASNKRGTPIAAAHGMSKSNFPANSHLGFGYDIFRLAIEALEASGMLLRQTGYPRWGAPRDQKNGKATCFFATSAFLDTAATSSVGPGVWSDHWCLKRDEITSGNGLSVELRAKRESIYGKKQSSVQLVVDGDEPRVRELNNQMRRINAYLMNQNIEGLAFLGLRRIFNNGDQPNFDWNKGGRFYSSKTGQSYERWNADLRSELIIINDEPVTEVDLRASHMTLLHALTKQPFDTERDPYEIEDIPRKVVKLWIAQVLGSSNPRPDRWSRSSQEDFEQERQGQWLNDAFPILEIGANVKEKHPLLVSLRSLRISTLDLQYHEAEILRMAMEDLMFTHDIPVLPIHDALISPQSKVGQVAQSLKDAFKAYVERITGDECLIVPDVTLKDQETLQ